MQYGAGGALPRAVARTIGEHFDVVVEMTRSRPGRDTVEGEPTAAVRARVLQAQQSRMRHSGMLSRDMPVETIRDGAQVSDGAERLLSLGAKKMGLSEGRANTTLKAARTIADLAGAERIREEHVTEALSWQSAAVGVSWHERA